MSTRIISCHYYYSSESGAAQEINFGGVYFFTDRNKEISFYHTKKMLDKLIGDLSRNWEKK